MDKKRKKSLQYFRQAPDNLNCAQSVLKGFQQEFEIGEDELMDFKAFGGGRAENGVCGALYAANRLTGSLQNDEFELALGSVYCRQLKKNKMACEHCVALADKLVEKKLNKEKESE